MTAPSLFITKAARVVKGLPVESLIGSFICTVVCMVGVSFSRGFEHNLDVRRSIRVLAGKNEPQTEEFGYDAAQLTGRH